MKVAVYLRVSDARDTRQNPETQLKELREYIERREWEIYAKYVDRLSGKSTNRKNFQLMLQHARERKFKAVVVWKLDRLSRSVLDFHNTVSILDNCGVRLISLKEGIDTDKSNATTRLLIGILATFAEFEREIISERVKAGIARRKSEGKQVGRQPLSDLKVGYLIERHNAGDSLRQIARKYKQAFGIGVSIETIRKYIRQVKGGE